MKLLMADGFQEAYLGTADIQQTKTTVAVYDADKCIQILQDRDNMNLEEAITFFDFNVKNAYMGEQTPIFVEKDILYLKKPYEEVLDAVRCLENEGNGVGGH